MRGWLSVRRILAEHLGDCGADRRFAFRRARLAVAQYLFGTAAPDQFAVLAVEQVDLQGANLIVQGAGFHIARAAPEAAAPGVAPATAELGAGLLLAVIDDQPHLPLEVAAAAAGGGAQAALVELLAHGGAYPLAGEVAVDPRVIGFVLHGRLLPASAAVE